MERKYEINVTVGVREVGPVNGGFQGSDTFIGTVEGLAGVLEIMTRVSDLMATLKGPQDQPQDRRR